MTVSYTHLYDGVFMTDWGNDSNIVKEVLAGGDVKMPSGDSNAPVSYTHLDVYKRQSVGGAV